MIGVTIQECGAERGMLEQVGHPAVKWQHAAAHQHGANQGHDGPQGVDPLPFVIDEGPADDHQSDDTAGHVQQIDPRRFAAGQQFQIRRHGPGDSKAMSGQGSLQLNVASIRLRKPASRKTKTAAFWPATWSLRSENTAAPAKAAAAR